MGSRVAVGAAKPLGADPWERLEPAGLDRARTVEARLPVVSPGDLASLHGHLETLSRRATYINRSNVVEWTQSCPAHRMWTPCP